MNLLIVNDYGISLARATSAGGAENRIKLLVDELLNSGLINAVHVIYDGKFEQCSFLDKVFYHPCDSKKFLSSYHLTNEVIKKHNINVLQLHNALILRPFSILSAKKYKIPSIWMVHDFWPLCGMRSFINPYNADKLDLCDNIDIVKCLKCEGYKSYIRLKLFRTVLNNADIGIVPGRYVRDLMEKHNVLKGRWKKVLPWINLKNSGHETVLRDKNIFFVGSLMPYKGARVAVEALKYIVKEMPEIKLKIAGADQEEKSIYRQKIDELAKKDGVLRNIEFLGQMDAPRLMHEYQKSGVFVFPTVCQELFGQVWAEAMANGCPVVSSQIGGVTEYIKDFGALFPPGDSKKLAEEVIKILSSPDKAEALSERAKKYAFESFNIKIAAQEMLKIYKELIKGCTKKI